MVNDHGSTRSESRLAKRSKRDAILAAAIAAFGEFGYETTKWSVIADRVGIGQTALYHYFESKAHCLLTIMRMQLERDLALFHASQKGRTPDEAIRAAISATFQDPAQQVLQIKILQRHMDLLAHPRGSEREEQERVASRQLVRQIEADWSRLIDEGVARGQFNSSDPKLSGRLVLGLVNSVWSWYKIPVRSGPGDYSISMLAGAVQDAVTRLLAPIAGGNVEGAWHDEVSP